MQPTFLNKELEMWVGSQHCSFPLSREVNMSEKNFSHQHEDDRVLQEARDYAINNELDCGHLIVEHGPGGQYCWVVKIKGTTRWKSRPFKLTSGKFGVGDTQPFRTPD